MNTILVIVEHRQGILRDVTFELINYAIKTAEQTGLSITAVLLGKHSNLVEQLSVKCDHILVMEDSALEEYNSEHYLSALEPIIRSQKPRLIVMGHTAIGMDLGPALAVRTGIPLITDCLDARFVGNTLEVQRQQYGGKINAHLTLKPFDSYMITIRPGTFPSQCLIKKAAQITKLDTPQWHGLKGRQWMNFIVPEISDIDITTADILVSIGRGIGKPENIPMVQAFADAIGAMVSCSRPVADKEWLPKSRQVGTSGKTVKPKIYIALGISGAFQHQVGMKQAETIIAVNTDPAAPIFNIAHYGIIGDIMEVIPALTRKFKPV